MSKTPTKEMVEAAQEAYATFGQVGHLRAQPPAANVVAAMLSAALQSAAETPAPQPNLRAYPQELTDDLRDILSMMMWNTGPIAHALRDGGQDIKRKAEEEQAEVMHWLIGLALEHGSEWRAKASDRIREIRDALAATATDASDANS